jgi:hypothetical protein
MAVRIGKKPLTNAEKQKRFRQRKKASGLVRRDVWTESDGFLAPPSDKGTFAAVTLKQFERELDKLLPGFEEWEREVVYAEIFEYAKQITPKFGKVFALQRQIEKEEMNLRRPAVSKI